jgi:type II secretion system protein D
MLDRRTVALISCCGLCLSAFAQPGVPGTPAPSPAPTPASAPTPAPATTPAPAGEAAAAPATTPVATPATPATPGAAAATDGKAPEAKPAEAKPEMKFDALNRRILPGEPTKLSFKQVNVEQLIPFIVESTGKVVLPQQEVLARRITLLNDKPIPRSQALDLVFLALQQTGVAIIENDTIIYLRDQVDIDKQPIPVLGPEISTLERGDVGTVAQKIFQLRSGTATTIGEVLKPSIPDYAKIAIEPESNQILITGPIALLQRIERVLLALDRPSTASLASATFHLKYADAEVIAQNIRDLYGDGTTAGRGGQQNNTNRNQQMQQFIRQFQGGGNNQQGGRGGNNQQGGGTAAAATSNNLRVTANTQQNAVTVVAEQNVIDQIRTQVLEQWDRPLPEEAVVPRVFDLKNTDAIKIRDVLEGLFGKGTATTTQGGGGGGNQANRAGSTTGTGRLAGQFSFQAIPEASRIIVVSKSPDNLDVIEKVIEELDKPVTSMIPDVIELKHATAEDLAEQINALLAQEGTVAQVRRTDSTLATSATNSSPFAASTTDQTTTQANQQTAANNNNLTFWWSRARVPTDNAGSGNLVAKARVVPVARQNALMVLAPVEYRKAINELINRLDRPGRQVLISAIIAEISLDDSTALGVRFSQTGITPTRQDNTVAIGGSRNAAGNVTQPITGTKNDLLPGLFDTSVLNVGVDLNILLQALAQTSKVTILSEPRIFTGDNQQAEFFDGQDIPFITNSQVPTGNNQNVVNSFDYKAVGIALRVRPRITPERDVDIKVNLELSSVDPSRTVNNQAVVDRRETTTQLIVQDGQTVVISGILRSEDSDVKRKIPGLGDIPLLGALFTNIEKIKTRTELVAFITPVVVNNPTEMKQLNEPARKRLEELRQEMGELRSKPDAGAPPVAPPIMQDPPGLRGGE